jgi:hypothetical protein
MAPSEDSAPALRDCPSHESLKRHGRAVRPPTWSARRSIYGSTRRRQASTSCVAVRERPVDIVDDPDAPGHAFLARHTPLRRRRGSRQLGGVPLNSLLREAKFAYVLVFALRP